MHIFLSLLIVPLFAELERSMTNRVKIFIKNHSLNYYTLTKMYIQVENCNGTIHLTEVQYKNA